MEKSRVLEVFLKYDVHVLVNYCYITNHPKTWWLKQQFIICYDAVGWPGDLSVGFTQVHSKSDIQLEGWLVEKIQDDLTFCVL